MAPVGNQTRHRHFGMWICMVAALTLALGACKGKSTPEEAAGAEGSEQSGQTGAVDSEAAGLFTTHCAACHTLGGGPLVGPDLAGVGERRDRDWLIQWVTDPVGMAANDPIGQQIRAEWPVQMPPVVINAAQIADVVDYMIAEGAGVEAVTTVDSGPVEISEAEFDQAKTIYFNRCAGCHGTLRNGATGPNIQPERTSEIGTAGLEAILVNGTPGGMPAWGRLGILSDDEINLMARYVQQPPPAAPPRPMEQIRESWNLSVPVAQRPTEPQHTRDWENYFGVVLRDAGQVAIIDGDSKELVTVLDTGFAVHILRSSSSGRYFYAVGRDGRVTMIDLWTETPMMVAQVQGCTDARSVDGSKFDGFEDRYVIEGCYWPSQYVVFDGQTLEPLNVTSVLGNAFDTQEPLDEVRVASIVASHNAPVWLVSLKESGYVAVVDYSQPNFPMVSQIGAERFLHDGGLDHTGRYFLVAANMRDTMAVIDIQNQSLVTTFETGTKPHPGRGANWQDPTFGWVNATTHIGQNRMAIYGADPVGNPEHAWQVVRNVTIPTVGSLFVKTHPNSPYVWFDTPLSNEDDLTRQVCVYSIADGDVERCWQPFDRGRAVHFEFNRQGTEVWVSGWDRAGELAIFDANTLEETQRLSGDWLITPTGKFNVYNTAHDVY